MRHDPITRRRTTCSRRQRSQPWPTTPRLADRIVPGLRVACRGISQGVEHSRLMRGEVLLPLVLALLLILAHRLLPRTVFPKALGQRQSSPTPKPVLSVAEHVPVLIEVVDAKRQTPYPALAVGHWLVVTSISTNQMEVRDSSASHIRDLGLAWFHTLFTGIGVVVWQSTLSLPRKG